MSLRTSLYRPIKDLADRGIAFLAIIVLLPILVVLSVLIFLDDPGSVIFKQIRAGQWHRPFNIYKFRTMRLDTPHLSTEEMRQSNLKPFTRIGPFLRRTSLDELPQLFNVLRGEMSLVGPRPALMTQDIVLKGRENFNVHQLRPGMTGLAQITGRDDLADHVKIEKDALYLRNIGPITDIILFIFTLRRLLGDKGVY